MEVATVAPSVTMTAMLPPATVAAYAPLSAAIVATSTVADGSAITTAVHADCKQCSGTQRPSAEANGEQKRLKTRKSDIALVNLYR